MNTPTTDLDSRKGKVVKVYLCKITMCTGRQQQMFKK